MTKISDKKRFEIQDNKKAWDKYFAEYESEINALLDKYGMAADGCLKCHELTLGLAKAIVGLNED